MRDVNFSAAACHQVNMMPCYSAKKFRRRVLQRRRDLGAPCEELLHWFEHHVDTMDNMLAQFLIANEIRNGCRRRESIFDLQCTAGAFLFGT